MSVESLFETLTIKEIKSQHIKSRSEIETKKEELRFLVSERYRDIIDAADNIANMNKYAEEITNSIKSIKQIYHKWDILQVPDTPVTYSRQFSKEADIANKLSLASQIKLMLNMSDLIWNALEKSEFIEAAMLFSVCRNMSIHVQLSSDNYRNCEVDVQLMFSRQWSSLSNLEDTISLICKRYLQSKIVKRDNKRIVECLVGIMLVEGKDLTSIMDFYFNCNEQIISDWFIQTSIVPIQQQLTSVASILAITVVELQLLFINGLVVDKLKELSEISVKNMNCAKEERIYHYLPDQIALFKPCQSCYQKNSNIINIDIAKLKLENWLQSMLKQYSSHFNEAFTHLLTVKSVYETYNDVVDIFNCDKVSTGGTQINDQLFEVHKKYCQLWHDLLDQSFESKLKVIIQDIITDSVKQWTMNIEKFLTAINKLVKDNEFNSDSFLDFLWSNSNKDVSFATVSELPNVTYLTNDMSHEAKVVFKSLNYHFCSSLNISSAISNKSCNFEALAIKLKAVRPEIYILTKVLNDQIFDTIMEIIDVIQGHEIFVWNLLDKCCSHLFNECVEWSQQIINKISATPAKFTTRRKTNSSTNDVINEEAVIFKMSLTTTSSVNQQQITNLILAQSLRSLYEFFPTLQAAVMTCIFANKTSVSDSSKNSSNYNPTNRSDYKRKNKFWRLPFIPNKRVQQYPELEYDMWSHWLQHIEPLKNCVKQFIAQGTHQMIEQSIDAYYFMFKYGFSKPHNYQHIITKWSSMDITETDKLQDDDKNPLLSLKVPTQCSWPMHSLLLQLSSILVNFAAHSLPKTAIHEFREKILESIINQYSLLVESNEFCQAKQTIAMCASSSKNYCQILCIQLIFDMRFLLEIINAKFDIEKSIQEDMRRILSEIEQILDPFDYQMMGSSLHQHLLTSVARDYQLYQILGSTINTANSTSIGGSGGGSTNNRRLSSIHNGTIKSDQPNQHNLIELASISTTGCSNKNIVRFGLLPISGINHFEKLSSKTQYSTN